MEAEVSGAAIGFQATGGSELRTSDTVGVGPFRGSSVNQQS